MSTAINTNSTAFGATLALNTNTSKLSTDIQQLSTGLKINSAADSPAGLVISQNMNDQLSGIQQATSNTNEAINETATADSALSQVQSLLTSVRQLAVDASNLGANDSSAISADQQQIASAITSINRISATTQYGDKNLLDGSATSAATTTAGSAGITGDGNGVSIIAQGAWNTATVGGTSTSYTTVAQTIPTASTDAVTYTAAPSTATWGGNLTINGTQYNLTGTTNSLANVNTAIASSGYQATVSGSVLTLTSTATGAPATAQSFTTTNLTNGAGGVITGSVIAQGTAATLTLSGGTGQGMTANGVANTSGAGFTFTFGNGMAVSTNSSTATTLAGTNIAVTAGKTTQGQALQYQLGANEGQTASLSIASTAASQLGTSAAGTTYNDANGNSQTVSTDSLADINVTTFKGAQDALAVIDAAQSQVSTLRASLGSFQSNVLQSNATSLGVAQQNLQASQSTITNADLASTVVSYTKDSILVQSATTALTYANQMPQYLLKLLQ
jgi:flagellin